MKTIEAVIRIARSDFYSPIPETKRIADAVKSQLEEALKSIAESESEDLRTIANHIYLKFCDGTKEQAYIATQEKAQ